MYTATINMYKVARSLKSRGIQDIHVRFEHGHARDRDEGTS